MTDPIVDRLTRNRARLLDAVAALDDAALDQAHPDPAGGTWTIRDVLTHVLNAEEDHCRVAAVIARGELNRLPDSFDLDEHNAQRLAERGHLSGAELLAALEHQRQRTLNLYASLSDDQRTAEGPHPVLGPISVSGIFKVIAMHDILHQRDIQAIRDSRR